MVAEVDTDEVLRPQEGVEKRFLGEANPEPRLNFAPQTRHPALAHRRRRIIPQIDIGGLDALSEKCVDRLYGGRYTSLRATQAHRGG